MEIEEPVVMETHGGLGKIFQLCYPHLKQGVVFEKDPIKVAELALQRPTWAVYECECEPAIAAGVGSHLVVNFLDLDPYGEPWTAIEAFFTSKREFAPKMAVVVNDGLKQKLQITGGWDVKCMASSVERLGANGLAKKYLEVCQQLLGEKAGAVGYEIKKWTGYYCGHAGQMTHYAAVLEKAA